MDILPHINVLIKPASSLCNLRCTYCFYLDSAKNREQESYGLMTVETLEQVIKNAFVKGRQSVTIAFQGGEPTLAGLDFFRKAVEFIDKYNIYNTKVDKAIQTNSIVIDDEWAIFLKENNFLVGVSLDGPKDCHDPFRCDINGKGSHKQVMASIEILRKHNVDFNILCVVNSITAKRIQSIYSFFKKNNFEYLQFIPCLQGFGKEEEKMPYTLSPKDFGTFMCNLFDLWYRDFTQTGLPHIRQFENYVEMMLGYPPESCGMSGFCVCQNVIEADGGVYPCDFYVLDKLKLGTIQKNSYDELYQVGVEKGFVQRELIVHDDCKACKFLNICRGGCRRYCEPVVGNVRQKNALCQGFMQFFTHCTPRMIEIARNVGRR